MADQSLGRKWTVKLIGMLLGLAVCFVVERFRHKLTVAEVLITKWPIYLGLAIGLTFDEIPGIKQLGLKLGRRLRELRRRNAES